MSNTYILRKGRSRLSDLINDNSAFPGGTIHLNANSAATAATAIAPGHDANDGLSWETPVLTMSKALGLVKTGGRVLFTGDVREELTGSNLLFDVTIQGAGSLHHPDLPSATYHPGACMWRPPASPTAATPLLTVRGRGWKFINVAFDCPVDAAAIVLSRNALSDVSEYDASHASFIGCRFLSGKYGIEDAGGCYNVTIQDCQFLGMSTTAIVNTSTAVAEPLNWKILDCQFPAYQSIGNATHIDSPLNEAIIARNFFGTVTSTALYVDLTGGDDNIVYDNLMMGAYDVTDYVAGTGDSWVGNRIIADVGSNTALVTTGAPTTAS